MDTADLGEVLNIKPGDMRNFLTNPAVRWLHNVSVATVLVCVVGIVGAHDRVNALFMQQPRRAGYGAIQCYIERKKTGMGGANSEYYLFITSSKRFLMAGKKKSGNKTSNYAVSMNKERVSDKGAG